MRADRGQIGNGELLTIADVAGFEIVITADQNIRYQQNLSGRRLSLVVVSTNHWPTLRGSIGLVRAETALAAFTTPSSGGWIMLGTSPS